MALKIEEGKRYVTRDGQLAGYTEAHSHDSAWPFKARVEGLLRSFGLDGNHCRGVRCSRKDGLGDCLLDLVAEYVEIATATDAASQEALRNPQVSVASAPQQDHSPREERTENIRTHSDTCPADQPGYMGSAACTCGLDTTNPKDAFGLKKPPLRLIPAAALLYMARVFGLGATKYGPYNWREKQVRLTVYLEAAQRHILAKLDGQDLDPESGMPHEAHAMACMAILVDAATLGKLVDDRPPVGAAANLIAELTEK